MNCFQTCAFSLNQTIDNEGATKCIASQYGGNHLKEDVSFQGDVFCGGGDGVMYEGHTIGHVMDEKFTCDGSVERGRGGRKIMVEKGYFWQHFCQYWRSSTL